MLLAAKPHSAAAAAADLMRRAGRWSLSLSQIDAISRRPA